MTNKATGVGETHAMVQFVTDPDGYRNGAQYNWYNGLPVKSYHLKAAGGAEENIVTYGYETSDRLNLVTNPNGGTVIKAYWDNWIAVATYTKIDAAQTRYSAVSFDGAGNTNSEAGDHPDAVSGKYSMRKYVYDTVGRTSQAGNVTAVNGSYVPIDDDAALGFLYTSTTYDVFDRPLTVTRPDTNTVQFSYTGCGCAGGATTTITDERSKKRKQVYDFLGRLSEAYELDGGSATYSKAVYNYDVRDLLQDIKHYNNGATAFQQRSFGYDGYARVNIQTTPEEGTVTYGYQNDDLVLTATNQKATGNIATFTYNNRHQVTGVSYNDAGVTPTVTYGTYDEYGGRTSMTANGVSTTNYHYNTYHQLDYETTTFTGLAGTHQLDYWYNYVGAPTSVRYTSAGWVRWVNYDYNYAGALKGVGTDLLPGAAYSNTSDVLNNISYRGFGGVKSATYGFNPRKVAVSYDAKRQQMTNLKVDRTNSTDTIINKTYDYNNGGANNGRIQKVTDAVDATYTATHTYDAYNRLTKASATAYGRGYTYDNWGNITGVTMTGAVEPGASNYSLSYLNNASGAPATNRINNAGFGYDNAGNQTSGDGATYAYEAANRMKSVGASGNTYGYDGDGRKVVQATGGYGTPPQPQRRDDAAVHERALPRAGDAGL